MELASNALIDLETWKTWYRSPPDDNARDQEFLLYINAASDAVEAHCRRSFQAATFAAELVDGDGGTSIYVSTPPIDTAQPVTVNIRDGINPTGLALSSDQFVVYSSVGRISLTELVVGLPRMLMYPSFPVGRQNIAVGYHGGFATIPARVQLATCLTVAAHVYGGSKDPLVDVQSAGGATSTRREPVGVTIPPGAVRELVSYVIPLTTTIVGRDPGDPYPLRRWWRNT